MLELLRKMRAEIGDIRENMATKADLQGEIANVREEIADVRSGVHSLRADVASDLLVMRKETSDQIAGLRRAVVEYHTSVIGHGIIISELGARVRRVEQHLDLPALDLR
jgi:hypothetical protein